MHHVHDELLNRFDNAISNNNNNNNNNVTKNKYNRSPYIEIIIPVKYFICFPLLPGKGTMYNVVDSACNKKYLEVHWGSTGTIVGPIDKKEEKDIQINRSDKILITGYRNIYNLETFISSSSDDMSIFHLLGKTVSWDANSSCYRFNGRFDMRETSIPKFSKKNILLEELFLILDHIENNYYSKNCNILVQDKNGFLKRVISMDKLSKTVINYLLDLF